MVLNAENLGVQSFFDIEVYIPGLLYNLLLFLKVFDAIVKINIKLSVIWKLSEIRFLILICPKKNSIEFYVFKQNKDFVLSLGSGVKSCIVFMCSDKKIK